MRDEKKMMLGSKLKAKKAPVFATWPGMAVKSPCSTVPVPTGTLSRTRLPNTKRAPSTAKPSRTLTHSPTVRKNQRPAAVRSTMKLGRALGSRVIVAHTTAAGTVAQAGTMNVLPQPVTMAMLKTCLEEALSE